MSSGKSTDVQKKEKRSFIEEARRLQIIEAAVDTIAIQGYAQTTLAKIADHASISTGLILYHFKDKDELMNEVLAAIIKEWEAPARAAVEHYTTPSTKLRGYIEARLVYIGTRPKQSSVMVELLFSTRSNESKQAYRNDETGFEIDEVQKLLEEGQTSGEFKTFNASHMAIMIRSTIDQFLGYSQVPGIDLEQYVQDLLGWYGVLITKKGAL